MLGPIGYAIENYSKFNYAGLGQVKTTTGEVVDDDSARAKQLKRIGQVKCETCANRKYKDGSNEADVSYKTATHISPESAASAVRSHEMEHVSNAYSKASKGNGEVVSANVKITTSICPECGRSYVSGGLTTTQIKFDKENPYNKNKKELLDEATTGNNIDYSV